MSTPALASICASSVEPLDSHTHQTTKNYRSGTTGNYRLHEKSPANVCRKPQANVQAGTSARGSGSNRAKNNDNGLTSGDGGFSHPDASGCGWCLAVTAGTCSRRYADHMMSATRSPRRRVLDYYWGICLVAIVGTIAYFAVASNGSGALTLMLPTWVAFVATIPWLLLVETDPRARRHICVVAIATAVSCSALTNAFWAGSSDLSLLTMVFPCCMVLMLTLPWLSRLESDARARRHILWITAALLISGTTWYGSWWGLGILAVPAAISVLFGYAFAVRAVVRQAGRVFGCGDKAGIGEEMLDAGISSLSGTST